MGEVEEFWAEGFKWSRSHGGDRGHGDPGFSSLLDLRNRDGIKDENRCN
jgi:hypothetical protein